MRIDTPKSPAEVVRLWEVDPIDSHAGAWAFAAHHHGGQFSPLYALLCEVTGPGRFNPGYTVSPEDIEHDPDGEWAAASAIYHEAACYRTEDAQAEFLRECLKIAGGSE